MAATEDKIARAARYYRKKLDSLAQSPESLSQAPSSQLRVIVEKAGAQRRTPALMAELDKAFKDVGLMAFPSFTDPFLKSTDRVCIFDAKQPIDGLAPQRQLFANERELQDFIWKRRDQLEEFHKRGLTGFRREARLDSGRRVDILCKRPSLNQLVAIELKVAQPDDRAAGQVQQYLDDLAGYATNHGFTSAHVILISGQPDKSVRDRIERYARNCSVTVEFMLYRVQTELLEHP